MVFSCKIYPSTIYGEKYRGNYEMLIDEVKTAGITNIIVPVFQGSRIFFPDEEQEETATNLATLKESATAAGIGFTPEYPLFNDQDTYDQVNQFRPVSEAGESDTGSLWYKPLCPSNEVYRNFRLNLLLKSLKIFEPSIISLDFLQYPYLYEFNSTFESSSGLPQFCYCDFCQSGFTNYSGLQTPTEDIEMWFNWRCENITYIPVLIQEEIEKTGHKTNIIAQMPPTVTPFPMEALRRFAGQDTSQWRNLVDVLSPHLYLNQTENSIDWAFEVLDDIESKSEIQVMPEFDFSLQYDETETASLDTLLGRLADQNIPAISLFHWELLSGSDDWISLIRNYS